MTPAELAELWTTPVAMLGRASDQAPAKMWRRWGRGAQWRDITARPRLALAVTTWPWPLYLAGPTAPTARVWRTPDRWDQPGYYPTKGSPTKTAPAVIRLPAGAKPAAGEDRGLLVDYTDQPGTGVEALGLRDPWPWEAFLISMATGGQFRPGDLVAGALAVRIPANAGTYDFRGSGGPKRWGMVTADEIRSGDVGHAMAMTGLTRWGPLAGFCPPARRVEHRNLPTGFPAACGPNDERLAQGGQRFAIVATDAEIEAMVYAHGHRGYAYTTACTLGRALRDWGVIQMESGRGDPQIETTREGFDRLGITAANEATFLDWLPFDRLYAVAAPS